MFDSIESLRHGWDLVRVPRAAGSTVFRLYWREHFIGEKVSPDHSPYRYAVIAARNTEAMLTEARERTVRVARVVTTLRDVLAGKRTMTVPASHPDAPVPHVFNEFSVADGTVEEQLAAGLRELDVATNQLEKMLLVTRGGTQAPLSFPEIAGWHRVSVPTADYRANRAIVPAGYVDLDYFSGILTPI